MHYGENGTDKGANGNIAHIHTRTQECMILRGWRMKARQAKTALEIEQSKAEHKSQPKEVEKRTDGKTSVYVRQAEHCWCIVLCIMNIFCALACTENHSICGTLANG